MKKNKCFEWDATSRMDRHVSYPLSYEHTCERRWTSCIYQSV